jgi:hypothetical protein
VRAGSDEADGVDSELKELTYFLRLQHLPTNNCAGSIALVAKKYNERQRSKSA